MRLGSRAVASSETGAAQCAKNTKNTQEVESGCGASKGGRGREVGSWQGPGRPQHGMQSGSVLLTEGHGGVQAK